MGGGCVFANSFILYLQLLIFGFLVHFFAECYDEMLMD